MQIFLIIIKFLLYIDFGTGRTGPGLTKKSGPDRTETFDPVDTFSIQGRSQLFIGGHAGAQTAQ